MNTLKSAAVILVLAGVLYGVYTALNKRETPPPAGMSSRDIDDMAPPQIDFAGGGTSTERAGKLPSPPSTLTLASEGHSPADLHVHANESSDSTPPSSIYGPGNSETRPPTSPPVDSADAGGGVNRRLNYETSELQGSGVRSQESKDDPSIGTPSPATVLVAFRRDCQLAEQQIGEGKFRSALATLSPHYHAADLSPESRAQLLAWLDALAAKVIYSREHLLESPYVVRGRETLFDVAERLKVPADLLANINGVSDPRILVPGTELKVVPGPMRAEVNVTSGELTLFLDELYAGRFPVSLGNEPPQPKEYTVQNKSPDRTYIGPDGRTIPANDPTNPYGQCWIDLGPEACIHGSPQSAAPGTQTLGCISLSPQDARDVYAMLVPGSKVVVKR